MAELALVTGGARNIGRAIALRLKADGYRVGVIDIAPLEELEVDEYRQADLADPDATAEALADLTRRHEITRLVNNVGVVRPAWLTETALDDFDAVLRLNARSALQCLQTVLPTMRQRRFGRVVSISSRVTLGKPKRTAYAASKGAINAMTRTWALELAADGITVNAVSPGTIGTSAFYQNNPPDDPLTKAIISAIPVGRAGTAEDIAHAVSFFVDGRSSFVTGQVLQVCGGLTVGLSSA
jgi:NAD(P)-dependent dehydrogenase (short-subunit alcohol dehydrogenase family)